ncbi:preprotein translocase subunit TatC [Fibrobacteres bacterium R8-0-B4]
MSVVDHLEALRWALVRCVCAVVVCAIPCGVYWRRIFDFAAVRPLILGGAAAKLIYTAPAEAVTLSLKVALIGGAVAASPYLFWEAWRFVSPGLYKKEKAVVLPAALASTVFFLLGVAFCYSILPTVLSFLTGFAVGQIDPYFKIDEYLSFLTSMCLAFGLAFELPVAAFVLAKMGVIDRRFLIRHARYAVVAIFIAAAVLTPPDVLSQVLLALPLLALYGLGAGAAFLAGKPKNGQD